MHSGRQRHPALRAIRVLAGREIGINWRRIQTSMEPYHSCEFRHQREGQPVFARRLDVGGLHRVVFEEVPRQAYRDARRAHPHERKDAPPGLGCVTPCAASACRRSSLPNSGVILAPWASRMDCKVSTLKPVTDRTPGIPCTQPGMFVCDNDEFARPSQRMAWRPPTMSAPAARADSHVLISR